MSTDLSELQIAYFMYHTVSDPLGNFGTDGVYPNSDYDNQYAYSKDALHLENALWIDIGDKEAIQSNIVNYGAATISFFYSSTYLNTAVGKKGAYYYNGTTYGNNHAVAIVGWDDNYPKTNFRIQPKANGAWLIKNSYGTGNGDGGYLWVSYYDRGITGSNYYYPGNTAVFTDFGEVSRFDNNYQYDGGIGLHYYYYPDGNASMSNIFVAKSHEKLGGVSFYTYGTNSAYTVGIFKLHGGDVDPTDGSLVGTVSGVQMYEGYHTVNLDSEIELMAGDRFSLVIDLIASPGAYAYVFVDVADTLFGTDYPYSNATCNTGESYLSEDGVTWEESDYNCRIKAFTVNDEEINVVVNNPANSHLFRVEGSGNEIQNNLSNKMTDIVYVAESGYYIPTAYSVPSQNGVTVTRNSDSQITVSGTPSASATIDLIGIISSSEQSSPSGVVYRTHVENVGWQDYVANGTTSGTSGQGKRLEAIQIMIVVKGEVGPNPQYYSYVEYAKIASNANNLGRVNYFTHVQNYGNQSYVYDGSVAGTFGEGLRLEGITLNLVKPEGVSGGISYCTHVENIGWLEWVNNGVMSGTSGQGLRLEAMKIELTGDTANPSIIQ